MDHSPKGDPFLGGTSYMPRKTVPAVPFQKRHHRLSPALTVLPGQWSSHKGTATSAQGEGSGALQLAFQDNLHPHPPAQRCTYFCFSASFLCSKLSARSALPLMLVSLAPSDSVSPAGGSRGAKALVSGTTGGSACAGGRAAGAFGGRETRRRGRPADSGPEAPLPLPPFNCVSEPQQRAGF